MEDFKIVELTIAHLNKVFPFTNGVSWAMNEDWTGLAVSDHDGIWGLEWEGRWVKEIVWTSELEHYYWVFTGERIEL